MNKKIVWIILAVIALVTAGNLFLTPYLHQRETLKIVSAVLNHWEKGEIPESFAYWQDQNKVPPVYNLLSYQIHKKIYDKKDDRRQARIFVTLEFPSGNILPSGKEWVFELRQTQLGWKITDFYRADQPR